MEYGISHEFICTCTVQWVKWNWSVFTSKLRITGSLAVEVKSHVNAWIMGKYNFEI